MLNWQIFIFAPSALMGLARMMSVRQKSPSPLAAPLVTNVSRQDRKVVASPRVDTRHPFGSAQSWPEADDPDKLPCV